MKRCPNCNKEYVNGNYCTTCGIPLVEAEVKYDIFGDPIIYDNETNTQVLDQYNNVIVQDTDNIVERKGNMKAISKFLTLISVGSLFIPLIGSAISIVALVLNISVINNNNDKKHIPYFAIALVTLILSIVFFVLLIKSGVLTDLMSETTNQSA